MDKRETRDVLRKARGYIEQGWTQGAYARDDAFEPVEFNNRRAVCFCAVGAVSRAAHDLGTGSAGSEAALEELSGHCADEMYADVLHEHNDKVLNSQAEALAWFDRAIADAMERGDT